MCPRPFVEHACRQAQITGLMPVRYHLCALTADPLGCDRICVYWSKTCSPTVVKLNEVCWGVAGTIAGGEFTIPAAENPELAGKKSKKGSKRPYEKRKPTEYNVYMSEHLKDLKAQHPELNRQDLMRLCGELWKQHQAGKAAELANGHPAAAGGAAIVGETKIAAAAEEVADSEDAEDMGDAKASAGKEAEEEEAEGEEGEGTEEEEEEEEEEGEDGQQQVR